MQPGAVAAALVLTGLLAAQPLTAQPASPPRVERVGPVRLHGAPGQRVTGVFRLTRAGDASGPVHLTPAVPGGWHVLDSPEPRGSGSSIQLVAVSVPRTAAAGIYPVRLAARDAGGASADSVLVVVPEVHGVAIVLTRVPRFAPAASSYPVTVRVTNRGNVGVRVRVSAQARGDLVARVDTPVVTLAPYASTEVQVRVATPARLTAARTSLVRVRAGVEGAPASDSATARVEVVPRGASATGPRLPVTVGIRGRPGGTTGIPVSVTTSGALDAAGRTRVDLRFRGAGAASSELGEQDEFSLVVRRAGLQLRAGDHQWSLSPLTDPGRSGSGAGARVGSERLFVEGFAQRNRRIGGSTSVTGLRAQVGTRTAAASTHLLLLGGDSAIGSARAVLQPHPGVRLEGEYGIGLGAGGGTAGLDAGLSASSSWGGVRVHALRTDAGYPGSQGGRRQTQAAAHLRPRRGLRLHGSWEEQSRVRAAVVEDSAAVSEELLRNESSARSRVVRAGVGFHGLALEYRDGRWGDVGSPEAQDRATRSLVVDGRLRRGPLHLASGVEGGERRPAGGQEASPFTRTWLRAGFTLPQDGSAWASIERHSGAWPLGATSTDAGGPQLLGSVQLDARLAPSTRLRLASQVGLDADGAAGGGYVDLGLEQHLRRGQIVRLRTRNQRGDQEGEGWKLWLDYELPIGLPTPGGRAAGSAYGRVVDTRGVGVASAMVRVGGQAALTDRRGRWSIGGLAPGQHVVEVDPLTVGIGQVPMQRDVLQVDLSRGGARVDVELASAARARGTIQRFAAPPFGQGGEPALEGPVPMAVVEASQGGERIRRTTDSAGRFDFTGLRPGRWVLRVLEAPLPPNTRMEPDSVVMELASGTEHEAVLRAMPARRALRIVSGGELIAGAGSGAQRLAPLPRTGAPRVEPSRPGPATGEAPERRTPAAPAAPAAAPAVAPAVAPARGRSGIIDWVTTHYTVMPGDQGLESIAALIYLDGSLWPKLWLANRDRLSDPARLEPGVVLVVPPQAPLTVEERSAAEAYRRHRSRRR